MLKPVDTATALASGSSTRPFLSQPLASTLPLLLGSGRSPFEATSQSPNGRHETEDLRPNPLTGTARGQPLATSRLSTAPTAACVRVDRRRRLPRYLHPPRHHHRPLLRRRSHHLYLRHLRRARHCHHGRPNRRFHPCRLEGTNQPVGSNPNPTLILTLTVTQTLILIRP